MLNTGVELTFDQVFLLNAYKHVFYIQQFVNFFATSYKAAVNISCLKYFEDMAVRENNCDFTFIFPFTQVILRYSIICIVLQGISRCYTKLYLPKDSVESENEGEIYWYLNAMNQENPSLLRDLKDYYLTSPADLERNITNFRLDKKYIYVISVFPKAEIMF